MNKQDANKKKFGADAEKIAAEYLRQNGYIVRELNWRPKNSHLEVDVIAQKGDTIIFVEVKARTSTDYDPAEAVDSRKMNKLVNAAEIYLMMQPADYFYRFDIITISGDEENYTLDHLPDAFIPSVSG